MSELATIKQDKIKSNLLQLAKEKENTISIPEVVAGLTKTELRVAKSGSKQPIKSLGDQELTSLVKDQVQFIARDLGIKNFTGEDAAYEATRFTQILKNYYDHMTFSEVKIAFELAMVGELDEFLPSGKDGKPDKNHYQNFSFDYISKILNAFKQYKNRTWTKANRLIPQNFDITEDQKKENKKYFISDILIKFDEYKKSKKKPNFIAPFIVLDEFKKIGLSSGNVISESDRNKAFVDMMSRKFKSPLEKAKIAKDRELGIENAAIESASERHSMTREIIRVFDELIESSLDLEDFLHA